MAVKVVAKLPILTVDLELNAIVFGTLNRSRKFNQTDKSGAQRRFADRYGHSRKANNAHVHNRGLTDFGERPCIDERVGFIFIHPTVVYRDIEIPIFNRSVGGQPVGQFETLTVIIELFKFDLDLNVVVFTRVR